MTEEEVRKLCHDYGYTDEEIDELIKEHRTNFIEAGLEPIPFDEIPIMYQRY